MPATPTLILTPRIVTNIVWPSRFLLRTHSWSLPLAFPQQQDPAPSVCGNGMYRPDGGPEGFGPYFGAFIVNSYLSFAVTSEFKITFLGIGPTEVRLLLIVLNTMMIILGTGFVEGALPFIPLFAATALTIVVYRMQKYIWRIDMEDKRRRDQ